jgi:hypothetical protein
MTNVRKKKPPMFQRKYKIEQADGVLKISRMHASPIFWWILRAAYLIWAVIGIVISVQHLLGHESGNQGWVFLLWALVLSDMHFGAWSCTLDTKNDRVRVNGFQRGRLSGAISARYEKIYWVPSLYLEIGKPGAVSKRGLQTSYFADAAMPEIVRRINQFLADPLAAPSTEIVSAARVALA